MRSVAIPSVAVSRLEAKSGRRRRKKKRRGEPFPIGSAASGGGKKSKRKGAKFEATIAKLFSAYFGCSVRRTPGSGGWATVGDFGPKGDLVFAIRKAPYHVECKRHEGWDLADLITGKRAGDTTSTNSIEKWWAQTIRDCPKKKYSMLVFARNIAKAGKGKNIGVPPLLMMRQEDFRELGTVWKKTECLACLNHLDRTEFHICELNNGLNIYNRPKTAVWCAADFIPHLTFNNDTGTRIVCLLSDFFKFVKPPKSSPRRKQWERGIG